MSNEEPQPVEESAEAVVEAVVEAPVVEAPVVEASVVEAVVEAPVLEAVVAVATPAAVVAAAPPAPPAPAIQAIDASPKSRTVAALLCFFLGSLGIHRFYVGKNGTAIAMIFTLGGLGVWVLIDFIMILVGSFKDMQGRVVSEWS